MAPTDPDYARVFGNVVHEEAGTLIAREGLPVVWNRGVLQRGGVAFRGRPDVRFVLGGGREAVWDITTVGQAGKARIYSIPGVEYLVELLYVRPPPPP